MKEYFKFPEKSREEIEIEIPEEEWKTLELIAQIVGGDFGMKVKLGTPGEWSYFDPENCSITLDPIHIIEDPKFAKFVAGHEGSHRAITPGPRELGLSPEEERKLYSQPGFSYIQNIIEDLAVNDWLREKFPGFREYIEEIYNKQLQEEGVPFVNPYVTEIIEEFYRKHGYYPRFIQFGSEIIRYWYQRRFSKKLNPAVIKALERTIEYVKESASTIPDPQKARTDQKEKIEKGQRRFEINTNDIWPEVKKLVEMDFHTEELRQMAKELRQKQKELEQKRRELEQAKTQGDRKKVEQLQNEIERLVKELNPFNQLPEDIRNELQEQIDKAIREVTEQLNKEIEEKQKQLQEVRQRIRDLEEEIRDLEEKLRSVSGDERKELEKQIREKKLEKLMQERKEKEIQEDLKRIQETLEQIESEEEIPYPEDKLSERTRQELDRLFKKLPREKQKQLKDKAQREFEDLEDRINEEIEGKLNKDKPESHRERREREESEREAAKKSENARIEQERIKKELEKILRENMTPYERARAEVVGLIDDLYYRLRRILKPEEYGEEETGYPAGKILDIRRAMQAEIDPEQKHRLWIRETAPEKRDYRFLHLIDLSGSMAGEKIEETFKGLIVVGEALDRIEDLNSVTLIIHQGIIGFHSKIFPFKEFYERFTKSIEDKLSTIPERTKDSDASTNTYEAILYALENLKQNLGETANFILVFSDGQPNYDIRDELKDLLRQTKEERNRLKIKIGLIWLGESEDEKELQELLKEYGFDFGLVMKVVKPEEGKSFSEALADLLEDIVKNPEKY